MSTLLRDLSPSPPRPDYWETPKLEVEEITDEIDGISFRKMLITEGAMVLVLALLIGFLQRWF